MTHYAEEILEEFEQALFLRQGRVYARGKRKELMNSKNLSIFLETPVDSIWIDGRLQLKFTEER